MLKNIIFREADQGTNPQIGTSPENVNGTEPAKTEKTFTQAELEAIVQERLARAKRKADEAAEAAKKEAEQKALAEQGEYKTLAEQRATELQEARTALEAAKAKDKTIERYESALKARVEADRKDLPKPILALLDKMDVADQLEWLAENLSSFKSDTQQAVGTPPRNAGSKGQSAPKVELQRTRSTI